MRALLAHCKRYGVVIGRLSNRPKGIVPEPITGKNQVLENCIVALVTVEQGDHVDKVSHLLSEEIVKMCAETNCKEVAILPFAHLSNQLAQYDLAITCLQSIQEKVGVNLNVTRGHFGSQKELLMHLHGHPGNIRYREF